MRIGIAFDLVPDDRPQDGPDDRYEEFDKPATIDTLARVFEDDGHVVDLLGDGRAFLVNVLDDRPDFVWNMAEGEGVGRCREARVPAVLEMLGIPHNGSDPLTLALCLDKHMAKVVVRGTRQVRVPDGWCITPQTQPRHLEGQFSSHFRGASGPITLILKPAFEGSSKGIRANSLVDNADEAINLGNQLLRDYQQPILVEEFISGDDVTVGVIGNGSRAEILGAMRISPNPPDDRFVYTLERKRVWDDSIHLETPARLSESEAGRLFEAALIAYHALGCRDVARIDFRLCDSIPYFLEANPLPGLVPDWSDLVLIAKGVGLSYSDLIRRILEAALTRVGLAELSSQGGRA